ncbi:MAG: FlgN protein, partial [Pseudomonadota bacterium]|nr:FlgN protein [Pseudomonadota bacterium]
MTDDTLLRELEQTCQQLMAGLQQEFAALGKHEYQTLPAISQTKQQLVEKLDSLDAQVRSRKNMQQHPRWPGLSNLLQQCQQQNIRNGKLLARSYQLS